MHKFTLKKQSNGEIYVKISAGNGEPILTGEGHKRKGTCRKMLDSLIAAIKADDFIVVEDCAARLTSKKKKENVSL